MALPVPTKSPLKTSPDAAILFAPLGEPTHLPLSRPFCSRRTVSAIGPKELNGDSNWEMHTFWGHTYQFEQYLVCWGRGVSSLVSLSIFKSSLACPNVWPARLTLPHLRENTANLCMNLGLFSRISARIKLSDEKLNHMILVAGSLFFLSLLPPLRESTR